LGGAIFNDSGSVTVHNSTFYNNSVTRGISAGELGSGGPGGDAGGAIFSRNSSTTIVNSTFSANQKHRLRRRGSSLFRHFSGLDPPGYDSSLTMERTSVLLPEI
jgi:hypothetical protein